MDISWVTKAYGWEGTLIRLNTDRNDNTKASQQRRAADKAHAKINKQLKDTRLMSLRTRLIKASIAGDEDEINKITRSMRAYLKEDQETGLYER